MNAITLDALLDRGVKEVVHTHAAIGTLLSVYNVGCVSCSVGTCRLRDVIDIHNLDEIQERSLLSRVAALVCPGREVVIPQRKNVPKKGIAPASPVMAVLVNEHKLILRLLAAIPGIAASLQLNWDEAWRRVELTLDFIRRYADQNHHAKEEDILFNYFDQDMEIMKVMRREHETGRTVVKQAAEAVVRKNVLAAQEYLNSYRQLLSQQIEKENTILFPWLDRQLTDRAVGEIFQRFLDVDRRTAGLNLEMQARVDFLENPAMS